MCGKYEEFLAYKRRVSKLGSICFANEHNEFILPDPDYVDHQNFFDRIPRKHFF